MKSILTALSPMWCLGLCCWCYTARWSSDGRLFPVMAVIPIMGIYGGLAAARVAEKKKVGTFVGQTCFNMLLGSILSAIAAFIVGAVIAQGIGLLRLVVPPLESIYDFLDSSRTDPSDKGPVVLQYLLGFIVAAWIYALIALHRDMKKEPKYTPWWEEDIQ